MESSECTPTVRECLRCLQTTNRCGERHSGAARSTLVERAAPSTTNKMILCAYYLSKETVES